MSSNDNDVRDDREQLEDRLTDQQLREAFSNETPPDLSGKILAAAESQQAGSADSIAPRSTRVAPATRATIDGWQGVAMAVCLLLLIGGGVLITHFWAQKNRRQVAGASETEAILVATSDIERHAVLSPDNLELKEWPKEMIPEGAVRDLAELNGAVPMTRITTGMPILQSMLGTEESSEWNIPSGDGVASDRIEEDNVAALFRSEESSVGFNREGVRGGRLATEQIGDTPADWIAPPFDPLSETRRAHLADGEVDRLQQHHRQITKNSTAFQIPTGFRVVSVRIDQETVHGLLMPGDRVDMQVFVRRDPVRGIQQTGVKTFLQDVPVFAVPSGSGAKRDDQPVEGRNVALLVTPADAEKVALAAAIGRIRLTLRGAADEGRASKPGLTPEKPTTAEKKPPEIKQLANGWRRSAKLPNASRLMVGENESLPLEGMQVNVQIDGFRARVLLDMYYLNPHERQLEGDFQIRLPNEASLYFFAFGETVFENRKSEGPDVRQAFASLRGENGLGTAPADIMLARSETWRAPKEARMVSRTKAAHAYRETVRRRVDPALVEWAGAGIFSARVFPLLPQKLHRVVIGYDVNLLRIDDDFVFRLDLPDHVGQCTVDLNVAAQKGQQVTVQPETRSFTAAGRTSFHYEQPEFRQFELLLADAGNTLIHGNDTETGPYFAASFQPNLPHGEETVGGGRAVFLVDTSLSSNPEKFNLWLSLLKATLTNNRDTIKQFAVLFFNIDQHWWQQKFVDNTEANVTALANYCHTLALEGATDLAAALRIAADPVWENVRGERMRRDYFLLSDGASTWGERDMRFRLTSMGLDGPLFAYRTEFAGTDIDMLTHVTRETGGAVFAVVGDAQVEAASAAHRKRPWQLVDVNIEGGNDLMLAGRPRSLFDGQQLLLVGRGLPKDAAAVSLKVRRGDEHKTIQVDFKQIVRSDLATRMYGQVATMGLEELSDATENVSAAYARHFRITGRTCSLLMLESEADYQRFNIKPHDDAFVVRSTRADAVIAGASDRMAANLGDPKAAFLAWIEQLEKSPGFSFEISAALKVALDTMPKSAFEVRVDPLSCRQQAWASIPESLREMLSARNFGYHDIMQEAQRRRTAIGATDALRGLSSLVEHRPGDLVLARDVAFSALDWGLNDQAYHLLRRVAESRPYEPQTYLAIANCLAGMNHADLAMIYYEIALNAIWADRFPDFKQIASIDYLHFLRQIESGNLSSGLADFAAARLASLSRDVDLKTCDLLVTIMWNTDGTDVDLHVIEPSGEECYYEHRTTHIGGNLTQDVTRGYGPEMYTLRRAPSGEFKIRAKYYASDQNRLGTRTRVFASIYENWGTSDQRVERRTVTLNQDQEMTEILTVKRASR